MAKEKDFYQVSLKLLLKNKMGEILALKAADNGSYAGYYDLPGGRIDTDEFSKDLSEIIKREIFEEIGDIKFHLQSKPVAVGRHLLPAVMAGMDKDVHILYLFFEAEYLDGEMKISDEHSGLKWLDLTVVELSQYFTSGMLEGVKMYSGR